MRRFPSARAIQWLTVVSGLTLLMGSGCRLFDQTTVETAGDAGDTGEASCRVDASSLPEPMRGQLYARRADAGSLAVDGDLGEFGSRWVALEDLESRSDNRMELSARWTPEHLHLGIEVRDDFVESPESVPPWNRDSVEVAWEPSEDPTSRSDRVRKWIFTASGTVRFGRILDDSWEEESVPEATEYDVAQTDAGYRLEVALPWSAGDIAPTQRDELTFCVRNNDRDDGDVERLGCLGGAESFTDPADWHTLRLVDGQRATGQCASDTGPGATDTSPDGKEIGSDAADTGERRDSSETGVDENYDDYDRTGQTVTVGSISDLESAVGNASPGDVIELESGTYSGDVTIGSSGRLNHPITITGKASDPSNYPVIDGGNDAGDTGTCMRLEGVSWVTVQNLRFENCWNKVIELENTQYVTVDEVDIRSGEYAVYAAGSDTHHTLIEDSHWKPMGRTFWEDISWSQAKTGDWEDKRPVALYGIHDQGGTVIRDNELAYVWNVLWDGFNGTTNLEFYDNYVHHVRDNIIEPERYVYNVHVYHNRMDQADHGLISVDSDAGGEMYLYGNVGRYDLGDPSHSDQNRSRTGGRIFKMPSSTTVDSNTYLDEPLYVFNNSWYNYHIAFPNRYQKNVRHYNNAYNLQAGMGFGDWGDWLTKGNEFDYDAAANGWNDELDSYGHESNGLKGTAPQFRDPENGDFRLQSGSPLVDAGTEIDGLTQDYQGAAPDIGAYEDGELVEGPPFYIRKPRGGLSFEEHPRVTRHDVSGAELTVYFSWSLEPSTLAADETVLFDGGRGVGISNVELGSEGRRVTFSTDKSLTEGDLDLCFKSLPEGTNGEKVTYWAATMGCR